MTSCDSNSVRLHSIWHEFSINGKIYKHLKDQVPLIDIILVTMANAIPHKTGKIQLFTEAKDNNELLRSEEGLARNQLPKPDEDAVTFVIMPENY